MKIGIEHEFVFRDNNYNYIDFSNGHYPTFEKIVNDFPYFKGDEKVLDCKSLEKRPKRCYVEGFERYDENAQAISTTIKGLELRTLPYSSIEDLVNEYSVSYNQMFQIAKKQNLYPILTSSHPFKEHPSFKPNLSIIEKSIRSKDDFDIAIESMFYHGLQVNFSIEGFNEAQMLDLVHKINYYTPFIIPFSFSSPFYNAELFKGLSYRAYATARTRTSSKIIHRKGSIIVEFGGFDACGDLKLLKSLLYLFKGLVLDKSLQLRATQRDASLVEESSLQGFSSPVIAKGATEVLDAAKNILNEDFDTKYLENILSTNGSYAFKMKKEFIKETNTLKLMRYFL